MKIGIKFGYDKGIEEQKRSKAKYAEIYFRLDLRERYKDLFSHLRNNGVQFGLHFWALTRNKYSPNLAYSPEGIADETENLIRKTIDIASENGAFYVNYHSGSLRLMELDFEKGEAALAPFLEISIQKGFESLARHSKNIQEYARSKNVEAYVEIEPRCIFRYSKSEKKEGGRLRLIEHLGMPIERVIEIGRRGVNICYDIGHAIAQHSNEPRDAIFEKILREAEIIAPFTKLVHVTTNLEPLNGADSHNGILDEDFKQNVFPDKEQLMKILSVFKKYPNILYIPEPPMGKMTENYFELKKLLM